MEDPPQMVEQRRSMVAGQIRGRGIRDVRLLEAMQAVPRHLFVPPFYQHLAYSDGPLPIGEGQTISQPYIVALMTDLLDLQAEDSVLEIGTGSGYQAAVLAKLARQVYTVEQHPSLVEKAEKVFAELGLDNITAVTGDGSNGLPEHAPYQGILVTAAAPHVPQVLLDQLDEGGVLVIPVGGYRGQMLEQWIRRVERFEHHAIAPVAFVPLRGDYGWKNDWPY